MSDERRALVRQGYDEVAESYLADRTMDGGDLRALAELVRRLATGARVLDAGCGAGLPVTKKLVDAGLATVGFDFSIHQLGLRGGSPRLASRRLVIALPRCR